MLRSRSHTELCTCFSSAVSEDKLILRKAPGGTDASLRFGIHLRIGGYSQISIFQLSLINSQLVLRPVSNHCCPMVSAPRAYMYMCVNILPYVS